MKVLKGIVEGYAIQEYTIKFSLTGWPGVENGQKLLRGEQELEKTQRKSAKRGPESEEELVNIFCPVDPCRKDEMSSWIYSGEWRVLQVDKKLQGAPS